MPAVPLSLLGDCTGWCSRRPRTGVAPLVPQHRRHLALRLAPPDIVRTATDQPVAARALDRPPQTNEVGRSAALIGDFSSPTQFDLPMRFRDRSSGRLNSATRSVYRYRYLGGEWAWADSPVRIGQCLVKRCRRRPRCGSSNDTDT